MGKHDTKLSRAFARVTRAFAAKDERAFDEAMDNLEERIEERGEDSGEGEPDIEVHNHVPDFRGMDTERGVLPEKDPPGFDSRLRDEGEAPPWFKKHEEATDKRFKAMNDAMNEGFAKWAKEEKEEPEHSEDEDPDAEDDCDPNLEMEDRRRNNDEPAERQEMAERIKERGGDRRRPTDRKDEANKEILGELEFEAPPGTGDKARRATDSRYLGEAFQDTLSKAEQLAPGIALPTFDSKAPPTKTFRQIARLRQTALDLAYNKADTRGIIDGAMSGRTFDSKGMKYGATRVLFNAAAMAAGSLNNQRATDRSQTRDSQHQMTANVQSIGDWNKRNREHYAGKR